MSINYTEAARLIRRGRQAEQRATALKGCVTGLISSLLMSLLKGWLFMLAVGVAHAHWLPNLPTIGFWWSVLFIALLPSLGPTSTKGSSDV